MLATAELHGRSLPSSRGNHSARGRGSRHARGNSCLGKLARTRDSRYEFESRVEHLAGRADLAS